MSTLAAGQKFERCRIYRYLGSGISGESYEAEDIVLQRKVTLKLIHPWSPLTDGARRQFFREMQDISILEHAYLANMLNYGEHNGQLFIARRYIGPGSLLGSEGRYWYKPPLDVPEAINLAHLLAQALQHIHTRGYVHGSLTMANIQVLHGLQQEVEPDLAPFLITDIGLAYFVRRFGKPQSTLLPVTAAPEQLGGRTVPASDQYALAIILYFWLTNRLPFVGSPDTIEQQKLSESFTSPAALNSQITPEQAGIMHRALSLYPEDRYPSILSFIEALNMTLSRAGESTSLAQRIPFTPIPTFSQTLQSEPLSFPVHLPKTPALRTPNPDIPLPPSHIQPDFEVPILQQAHPTELTEMSPDFAFSGSTVEPHDHAEEILSSLVNRSSASTSQGLSIPTPASYQDDPIYATSSEFTPIQTEIQRQDTSDKGPGTQEIELEEVSAYLLITSRSSKTPREIKLEGDEITIGRAGSSHILLDQDTLTSRHQAVLKYENGNYVLYDQRSAYGTIVNGQPLNGDLGYLLHEGDKIGIGSYDLLFTKK